MLVMKKVPEADFTLQKGLGRLSDGNSIAPMKIFVSYFGRTSDPWHMKDPIPNQRQFEKPKNVSSSSGSPSQGWDASHSSGVSL